MVENLDKEVEKRGWANLPPPLSLFWSYLAIVSDCANSLSKININEHSETETRVDRDRSILVTKIRIKTRQEQEQGQTDTDTK